MNRGKVPVVGSEDLVAGLLPPAEQTPGPIPAILSGTSMDTRGGNIGHTPPTRRRCVEAVHHTTHPLLHQPRPPLVTTREEGSTLCDVSVICVGNVGIICSYVDRCRTVLVMSDMKARLTSRVVPPYTSYTGHTVAAAAAW